MSEKLCPMSFSVPANGFNLRCIRDKCACWDKDDGHINGGQCGLISKGGKP